MSTTAVPPPTQAPAPLRAEKQAILVTVWGNLFMAALGFGFALATGSQAVLLDGAYSLIGVALALLSLRVSALVMRPDDERYPFGYVAYEPILNFAKGLLIGSVTLFALVAALKSLLAGGREIATGLALLYALVAAAGCLLFALLLQHRLRRIASPLVEIDRQNWLIDGFISLAVAIGFLVALLLSRAGYPQSIRYVDPVITALLCLAILPIPFRILLGNWRQIVAQAPPAEVLRQVAALVDAAVPEGFGKQREIRVLETGRVIYVHLYFHVDDTRISDCDRIRQALWQQLQAAFPHPALDVSFTTEPKWFRHASGDV